MARKMLLAVAMAVAVAILLGFMLPVPAHAKSKCQYFNDGREPRCSVTSDGAREPYIDDRPKKQKLPPAHDNFRRSAGYQAFQQRRAGALQERAAQWASHGRREFWQRQQAQRPQFYARQVQPRPYYARASYAARPSYARPYYGRY